MESPCSTAKLWAWNRRCLREALGVSSFSFPLLSAYAGCLAEVPRDFSLVLYMALAKGNPQKAKRWYLFYLFCIDREEKVSIYLVAITCKQISLSIASTTSTISECRILWRVISRLRVSEVGPQS